MAFGILSLAFGIWVCSNIQKRKKEREAQPVVPLQPSAPAVDWEEDQKN
ncbi:MAG: hypothetical protein AAGG68_17570 [Bacteroidota bacterium]